MLPDFVYEGAPEYMCPHHFLNVSYFPGSHVWKGNFCYARKELLYPLSKTLKDTEISTHLNMGIKFDLQ